MIEKFEYDRLSSEAEMYETLQSLMEHWENEIVEFKEAKGHYDEDKVGQYFSAISNEANLKNQQFGWLVLGVSEKEPRHVVGTSFKKGDSSLLEKFKYTISKGTTDGISFMEIYELYPVANNVKKRVLMFKIPAATTAMPTAWNKRYFARYGDSLVPLNQEKIDRIRSQTRKDWSRQIIPNSSINNLDPEAIAFARQKYKEKLKKSDNPVILEQIDRMSDEEFLTALKLIQNGKLTNAALLLLGNSLYDYLFDQTPSIMWRLLNEDGSVRDYQNFTIPFISVTDKVYAKIRNLTYRYMANQQSLFPKETQQYDSWSLRELLHNCIAHSNYQLGGRIYVNELNDSIVITNPGSFLPKNIETVLQQVYTPPFYRNQLLSEVMAKLNMIDTSSSGIKSVYLIQKKRYFPMPDYDFSDAQQVRVTVYGKILDDKYTHLLYENNDDLDLETVFLIDKVQKHEKISKKDADRLRKRGFVEGRYPHLYVSFQIAERVGEKAEYIHNKGLNESVCRQLILEALGNSPLSKKELIQLLNAALPAYLTNEQKSKRVSYIIQKMKKEGLVEVKGKGPKSEWKINNSRN